MKAKLLAVVVTLPVLAACGRSSNVEDRDAVGSLYNGLSPRPGPDLLYEPAAYAPQLDNDPDGPFRAAPILVSGASAYRSGEFLYQDFLYDDYGGQHIPDPTSPVLLNLSAILAERNLTELGLPLLFSLPNGTYTYPTDPSYAGNAADLVEFRVKPLADSTAFRVTLNTLIDPSLVGFTIALGGTEGADVEWVHGANVRAPAEHFLTVRGANVDFLDALGAAVPGAAPTVKVDTVRRQFTIVLPHNAWRPGKAVVRMAIGVGLWDAADDRYLLPGLIATARKPGGAGLDLLRPAAFFNVGFRYNAIEPYTNFDNLLTTVGTSLLTTSWWRDRAQGTALRRGNISMFHADVDFQKLAGGDDDDMPDQPTGVPQKGPINRILASRFETAQGVSFRSCLLSGSGCPGQYLGQLQPYALYIPDKPQPEKGWGLTLLLHSLTANYNQFSTSNNQKQFGERGSGSIALTPHGRGPDGFYEGYAAADVFEAWADVARHYKLDSEKAVIAGYSMGGFGSFTLAAHYPDLFSKAQPTVGTDESGLLGNLRNVPVLMWNALLDELVAAPLYLATAAELTALRYRVELNVFPVAEHLTLTLNDEYAPAAAFLGDEPIDRNPFHVTFSIDPSSDHPEFGLVSDHAYWISDIRSTDGNVAKVDAISHGFGQADPESSTTPLGLGVLIGGNVPLPLPYTRTATTWGPPAQVPVTNALDLDLQNVQSLSINVDRARLTCDAALNITSDVPVGVRLYGKGCERHVLGP